MTDEVIETNSSIALGWDVLTQIRDAEEKILLIVPKSQ